MNFKRFAPCGAAVFILDLNRELVRSAGSRQILFMVESV